ncbi:hypothetical protein WJX72_001637 [[Myrmecia] bisecta]|uniref:Uncharacterized protein n=1 Tax=[Myrmecia] bisecta TaxID=41462 RepID=A0AAW1R605_9CHLO
MVARKKYEVPVFHPTLRDLGGSFETFVESVERRFAQVGICKIVAPKSWTPRKAGYDDDNIECEIPRPIRQHATGTRGLYRTLLVEAKPMSLLKDFKPLATHKHNLPPENADTEAVERAFWRSVTISPPLYGADVPGSMFDEDLKGWNLRHLDSLLSRTLSKNDLDAIPGVNTPYLYFGMWRSIFAWHTEDLDLHSINYLHYGAPKTWYCIPPAHRERFEVLVKGLLPDLFRSCPEFFRHKELLISPQMLQAHNIPVVKVTQYPGEFIINYPGAYHAGFNHGYNCAESTNFATRSWIGIGAQARVCDCHSDAVKIEMRMFLDEANPRAKRILRDNLSDTESSESESEGESEDESDSDDSSDEDAPAPRRKRAKVAATACKAAASGGRSMTADKPTARRALVSGGRNMAAAKPTSSVHGRGGQAPGNKRARVDSTARAPASKRRKTAEGSASARKPGRSPGGPAKPAKQSAAQQSGAKSNSKTAAAKSQPGKPQGTTAGRLCIDLYIS